MHILIGIYMLFFFFLFYMFLIFKFFYMRRPLNTCLFVCEYTLVIMATSKNVVTDQCI